MRNFIISIICLGLLIGVWTFYDHYSDDKLRGYADDIENHIIKDIEAKKWGAAEASLESLAKDWHQYKETAHYFLDIKTINEADYTLARAKYYVKAKDESNAPGELACFQSQITFLHQNESLSFKNIF